MGVRFDVTCTSITTRNFLLKKSTTRALGEQSPKDPLVARLVADSRLPWDESLSGAATTLALAIALASGSSLAQSPAELLGDLLPRVFELLVT